MEDLDNLVDAALKEKYPMYPSRMSCLYVSETLEEARRWGEFFARIGRPDKEENIKLAEIYWRNEPDSSDQEPVREVLVDGTITVMEIVEEINANMEEKRSDE